jgi:spermidine synthase
MATISFLEHPSTEQLLQILALYRQAAWWDETADENLDLDILTRLIQGSHCFAVAVRSGAIIGMGRAISDGVSDAYIQDVAVREEYRKKGIGSSLVDMLIKRLQSDNIGWIGLIAERGSQPFYKKFGFQKMKDAAPLLLHK